MNELKSNENNDEVIEELLELFWALLSSRNLPDDLEIPSKFQNYNLLQKCFTYIIDLRRLCAALNKGDLGESISSRGYVLSNLKALQSNLRHLTWQTKKIADGDFSQKVDFMGEFSISFNEMTRALKEYSTALKKLANFDPLTQIPNRLFLNDCLTEVFEDFLADRTPFCVMIFDIDFFKRINDTYGHDAGDLVLRQVSELLSSFFRSSDIIARYGGEEFVAVLPGAKISTACDKADLILKKIRETPFNVNAGESIRLTISAGISQVNSEDKDYNDTIKRSDEALYFAKESGRDQVVAK